MGLAWPRKAYWNGMLTRCCNWRLNLCTREVRQTFGVRGPVNQHSNCHASDSWGVSLMQWLPLPLSLPLQHATVLSLSYWLEFLSRVLLASISREFLGLREIRIVLVLIDILLMIVTSASISSLYYALCT